MRLPIMAAALSLSLASAAQALTFIYDERVSGDAGSGFLDRVNLSIVDGANAIFGRYSDGRLADGGINTVVEDFDQFALRIPVDRALRNLTFEVGTRPEFLENLSSLELLLTVSEDAPDGAFGRTSRLIMVNLGDGSIDVSPPAAIGLAPTGIGRNVLDLPLPAGDYVLQPTHVFSGSGGAFAFSLNYQITFEIFDPNAAPPGQGPDTSIVPAPAAAPLMALGVAALVAAARRRRRG